MPRAASFALLLALAPLASCLTDTWEEPVYPAVTPGAPRVGASEGHLHLPVGTPLSGYTNRCGCLGGTLFKPDDRETAYNDVFVPSAGVQTHPAIKVVWIENGDDHLVITKTDSIYSFDGLVEALELQLSEATGIDLDGKVIHTANHSHASYGGFSDALTFYLGSDTFNPEVFERFAGQVADVALDAYETREDAKIGLHIATDWDPDDRVYSDRRGENNELEVYAGGETPLPTGKDPELALLRFDRMDDSPLAVIVNFGMHGTVVAIETTLVSTDSGGGIEAYFQEAFVDDVPAGAAPPVVMFSQGGGGDLSPRGEQGDYARLESLGDRATPVLYDIWANTPTSADALAIQTVSRSIPTHTGIIEVTRNGEVDWRYAEVDPERTPDNVIYDEDGAVASPIDEWNTEAGGIFCGQGFGLPIGQLPGVTVEPYTNCINVEQMAGLVSTFFDVDGTEWGLDDPDAMPIPIPDTLKAGTSAARLDGLSVTTSTGTSGIGETVTGADVLFGFFPGETTTMYAEQWRRRARRDLGFDHGLTFGYSQDHEGYLLIAEDWLAGGYEPDISIWGPLGAEFLMEEMLGYSAELLLDDVHQPTDPFGVYGPTTYPERSLPTVQPDLAPNAGTRITAAEAPEALFVPRGFQETEESPGFLNLDWQPTVQRAQGIVQLAWIGGDPGVDTPIVTIEHQQPDGSWEPLRTPTGRLIHTSTHDVLVTHTPDPLEPVTADQTHYWWAAWQAVDHAHDRTGLPLGTYRLRVEGQTYAGGAETWPWPSEPYSLTSDEFELVPADLTVERAPAGEPDGLRVSLQMPFNGYRYIVAGGDERGQNPVEGELTLAFKLPETEQVETVVGTTEAGRTRIDIDIPPDAFEVTVTDAYGNTGLLTL
jgi:neutral ceramidase